MVPEVPLSSPVWQIYASVMKSSLTGLSSVLNQSRCGICYHAYTHLLILSWLSCLAETIASLHALAVLPSLTHTSRKDLRLGPREHLRCLSTSLTTSGLTSVAGSRVLTLQVGRLLHISVQGDASCLLMNLKEGNR